MACARGVLGLRVQLGVSIVTLNEMAAACVDLTSTVLTPGPEFAPELEVEFKFEQDVELNIRI